MFLPPKHEKKNIPADAAHILTTEIHSTVLKNENLTTKRRKNKAEKQCFFKTIFQMIFKQTKPSNKISTSKTIGKKNKPNKIAKNYWLCRYKRSTSNKTNYMFLSPKIRQKNNKQNNK